MVHFAAAWLAHQRARWMQAGASSWRDVKAARWRQPERQPWPAALPPARKYRPDQPRVPRGHPEGGQWTEGGGGGAAITVADKPITDRRVLSDATPDNDWQPGKQYASNAPRPPRFGNLPPGTTQGDLIRFELTVARTEEAIRQIRRYEPTWRPRTESVEGPGSIAGAIARAEARLNEAEEHLDKLRTSIGGNLGPPLEVAPRPPLNPAPLLAGPALIGLYRSIHNIADLFGNPTWPSDSGTVAVTKLDAGTIVFGVNSTAPGYTAEDRRVATAWRSILTEKYPDVMSSQNSGYRPNNALFHAEANVLLRLAHGARSALAGQKLDVQIDRDLCGACRKVLPHLGVELGNPVVRFIGPDGREWTMWNGRWLSGASR